MAYGGSRHVTKSNPWRLVKWHKLRNNQKQYWRDGKGPGKGTSAKSRYSFFSLRSGSHGEVWSRHGRREAGEGARGWRGKKGLTVRKPIPF